MYPTLLDDNGNKIDTGFGVCNLTEINGSKIKTKEAFFKAARAAAIMGTIQATYTDFNFVTNKMLLSTTDIPVNDDGFRLPNIIFGV